jgi:hypothetical protein
MAGSISRSIELVALALLLATPAAAQWYAGLELGVTHYGGAAHDTTSASSDGHPGGGAAVTLALERRWEGRWGATLRAGYANPGFAVAGNGLSFTDKTTGSLVEFAASLNTRVRGIGSSGAVWVAVGPALHLWDVTGQKRVRLGALGAAQYEWPIAQRFLGQIRFEGLLSPSWFDAADVPSGYVRRLTWRYGAGLAVRYRL